MATIDTITDAIESLLQKPKRVTIDGNTVEAQDADKLLDLFDRVKNDDALSKSKTCGLHFCRFVPGSALADNQDR